jgi:hypothetical protein
MSEPRRFLTPAPDVSRYGPREQNRYYTIATPRPRVHPPACAVWGGVALAEVVLRGGSRGASAHGGARHFTTPEGQGVQLPLNQDTGRGAVIHNPLRGGHRTPLLAGSG